MGVSAVLVLLLQVVLALSADHYSTDSVPVILWSNMRLPYSVSSARHPAGQPVIANEFQGYLDAIHNSSPDITYVLIEKEVDPSTLMRYSDSLPSIKAMLTAPEHKHQTKYMQRVEGAVGLLLGNMADKKIIRADSIHDLPSKMEKGSVVVVEFSPPELEVGLGEALKEHDHRISEFMKTVPQGWTHMFYYTSRSSMADRHVVSQQRTRRNLLAVEGETTVNQTSVVSSRGPDGMYFVETVTISRNKETPINCVVSTAKPVITQSDTERTLNFTCNFTADATSTSEAVNLENFGLSFLWTLDNGTDVWYLSSLVTSYDGADLAVTQYELARTSMAANHNATYYCTVLQYYLPFQEQSTILSFGKLQLDPFANATDNSTFSSMNKLVFDCEPFFSIEAWTVLLVVLILLMITIFGMCMLSTLSTFDQFDDPKGKTIQVNAGGSE